MKWLVLCLASRLFNFNILVEPPCKIIIFDFRHFINPERYGRLKPTAMKRHLLLLATLSSLCANGQTSVYHPFPDSNAVWNFHFQWYCFANGTADEYYSITISGDTIIGSQTYHKLSTPFVQSFSTGNCGGSPMGYRGAI